MEHTADESSPVLASCYCGATKLSILSTSELFVSAVLCHCEDCRKACAGVAQWAAYLERKYVTLVSTEKVSAYTRVPGALKLRRCFCSGCGSRVYNEAELPDGKVLIGVFPGTFDDIAEARRAKWQPVANIFCKDAVTLKSIAPELEVYEKDRLVLVQDLNK